MNMNRSRLLILNKMMKTIKGLLLTFLFLNFKARKSQGGELPGLKNGDLIRLKSWKGDYLHRPDSKAEVTTWYTGIGNDWKVLKVGNKTLLKSWKGDYLHRPDSKQGVTTWHTGVGNSWSIEKSGDKFKLRSWKGDYLHRPDSKQGVTTWHTGHGNLWTVEKIDVLPVKLPELKNGDLIRLKSWKGDYLHRPDSDQGVTTWHRGIGNDWTVLKTGNQIQLKSWKGDYLHRPDSKQGVTTWHTGVGNSWKIEPSGNKIKLRSWKDDYLHRADTKQGVTTWHTGHGNLWTVETINVTIVTNFDSCNLGSTTELGKCPEDKLAIKCLQSKGSTLVICPFALQKDGFICRSMGKINCCDMTCRA